MYSIYTHWMYKLDTCITFIFIYLHMYMYTHVIRVSHQYIRADPPPGLLNTADLLEKISQLQVGQLSKYWQCFVVSFLGIFFTTKGRNLTFWKQKKTQQIQTRVSGSAKIYEALNFPFGKNGHVQSSHQDISQSRSRLFAENHLCTLRNWMF